MRQVEAIGIDWFSVDPPDCIDVRAAGIYLWKVVRPNGLEDTYVGRATKLSNRMRAYPGNVRRMINSLPYRNGGDYRPIHHVLRLAHDRGWSIRCTPIENCPREQLAAREAHWIEVLKPTLNGLAGRTRLAQMQVSVEQ